jgi:glutamine synthetase
MKNAMAAAGDDAAQGAAGGTRPDEARAAFADELAAFRAAHPGIGVAEVFVIDLNGTARGKLVPIETLGKLAKGTMKMPSSTPGLDIFGEDVEEAGIAIQTGDPDGALDPVPGSLRPLLWAGSPTAQVQATIRMPDGRLSPFDPRNVLARVAAQAAARGLHPCMALELEFFLIDPREPRPPMHPDCGGRLSDNQVYDLNLLREFEPVISRIAAAARALGAPAETVIAEFGTGQFEMNLVHTADALAAADQMVALKRAIRGTARAEGLDATFMAKPYGDKVGSGLHLHLSLQDGTSGGGGDGTGESTARNVFDSAPGAPNDRMRHAMAGMLRHMADCQLIFAPHLNSYRRMVPGSFVPVEAHWAFDNRGSALRLPDTCGAGARIEHRVAGSDANPYLVAAAILAAALAGIDERAEPPPPLDGRITPGQGEPLPLSWAAAEDRFSRSDFVARWLGEPFRHVYGAQKRQEREHMLRLVTDREYEVYLRRV